LSAGECRIHTITHEINQNSFTGRIEKLSGNISNLVPNCELRFYFW
jgi:hypothetical protein